MGVAYLIEHAVQNRHVVIVALVGVGTKLCRDVPHEAALARLLVSIFAHRIALGPFEPEGVTLHRGLQSARDSYVVSGFKPGAGTWPRGPALETGDRTSSAAHADRGRATAAAPLANPQSMSCPLSGTVYFHGSPNVSKSSVPSSDIDACEQT